MTVISDQNRVPSAAIHGVVALLMAAVLGFGVGVNVDWPNTKSEKTISEHGLPDWHGNVKRSQGR